MEYIYTSLLLHSAKQQINEANVKRVLEVAGVKPEEEKVKALVATLDGVDIEAVMKEAAVPVAVVAQVASAPQSGGAAKKEEKKEEKKSEEDAAAGLAGLFG